MIAAPTPQEYPPHTHGNTDTAYQAADHPPTIDPATRGLLWRVADNFTTLTERYTAARDAAAHGPGQPDTHILTRTRLSRDPAHMTINGTLADPEAAEWLRRLGNGRRQLRRLADYLDTELTRPITTRTDTEGEAVDDDE